ncbi:hypothetical protein BDY19DRAFT_997302 [Irpex rosettiformis]|uniref:Uncharacterized protein n=1 Tax=Irpex rosettiformis TaxID=378272 RepID=A0ACB8TSB7_9APHY|nr:hypothetical protein BDY19DRAFT_997302 [Irpex rosettiformis]
MPFSHTNNTAASPRDTYEDVTSYFTHISHPPHQLATYDPQDMGKAEKGHPAVDILVNSDTLILRGTGVDVAPALLSGNVVLYLSEATSIKEITLSFRGKARIPPTQNESLTINASPLTYVVCHHEWSFLEGDRSHSHTLKAGRHLFPFQLQIGGSLPCSIATSALGGASVSYKLRASIVRPGFALSLTQREINAIQPIHILRGFTQEALEYQQTLEIENTWPEKLMYSIMIPHKAWPAGDRVTAVVKFQPLVKGARVQSVTTTINETVKLHGRSGVQENNRVIATAKHEIIEGQAICVDERQMRYRIPLLHHGPSRSNAPTPPSTSTPISGNHAHFTLDSPGEMTPLTTVTTNSSASSGSNTRPSLSSGNLPGSSTNAVAGPSGTQPPIEDLTDEIVDEPSTDVITTLHVALPRHATPSHSLEPIQVSHRIRWSIMIANQDGHVSELRCSLPLHVLDNRLYDEAHSATLATRRLLLGSRDVDGGQAVGTHGEGNEEEEDLELPTYRDHVRDRVANAFLPETALMRMTNPWVFQGVSPIIQRNIMSNGSSGLVSPAPIEPIPYFRNTPLAHDPLAQLPAVPSPDAEQLRWVNSELLLSLSSQPNERAERPRPPHPEHTPPESAGPSRGGSRHGSRFPSRRGSRANSRGVSPERQLTDASRMSLPTLPMSLASDETYVHSQNAASRNTHGLFHISMKPFTTLTSQFHLPTRSHTMSIMATHSPIHGSGLSSMTPMRTASSTDVSRGPSRPPSRGSSPPSSGLNTPAFPRAATGDQIALHRAFIETPDYEIASRGFLGGGIPPLSSFAGLPSYEEAANGPERSMSDTDLAGRMEAALRMTSLRGHLGRDEGASTAPPSPPRRAATQAQV